MCEGLSTEEILSRLIYGECTYGTTGYYAQRCAIGWVLENRINYSGTRFPKYLRETALQAINGGAEFSVISGSNIQTQNARIIGSEGRASNAWSEATRIACSLVNSSCSSEFGCMISKPAGFTSQMFFVSKGTWDAGYSASGNTLNGNAVTDILLDVGDVGENQNRNIFFNFVNP